MIRWKEWIGRAWLRAFGWRLVGERELPPRFVLAAAPHTSNWDAFFMLATAWSLRVDLAWLGKDSLFRPPFGRVLRWLGGIPVDRRARHNVVARAVEEFARRPRLILAVPPEGTRAKVDYWKSGFYHIARGAGVPIGFAVLDYARRQSGLGKLMMPTGDVVRDMDEVRAFFHDIHGRHPEKQGIPRLREEEVSPPEE